jgi:hypothetical protein
MTKNVTKKRGSLLRRLGYDAEILAMTVGMVDGPDIPEQPEPSRQPANDKERDMLNRHEEMGSGAAKRALGYRLRKAGLLPSAAETRAANRAIKDFVIDGAQCSERTWRRHAKKRTVYHWREWLAKQPPAKQAEQEAIHAQNMLIDKFGAFLRAWDRASPDDRKEVSEFFDDLPVPLAVVLGVHN